jgi:hypothetical protein
VTFEANATRKDSGHVGWLDSANFQFPQLFVSRLSLIGQNVRPVECSEPKGSQESLCFSDLKA